jgi:DNA-binding ferritin-like protein
MIELYSDIVALYNKVHMIHIRTVNMEDTETLHPLLWSHYSILQDMVDRFWEDIIQKWLEKDVPTTLECLKKTTISENMMYDDVDEIVDDLYKDYEYLKNDIKQKTNKEKDLLIQNILIDFWDTATKLCADIKREI